MAHSNAEKPVKQPGVHAPEIKAALNARAMYRTIIVTSVVFLLLACLAVISSSSMKEGEDRSRPRGLVLVVPHLAPDILEAAMESNKAPFIGLLSAADGIYTRLQTRNADLMASLVTMLTGNENSTATNLVGATSFLQELKRVGKKPIVLAPSLYWSAENKEAGSNSSSKICSHVGLFDSECSGLACPAVNETAYCNVAEKLLSCNGKAHLYQEETVEAFHHFMQHDGDLLYVHMDLSNGTPTTNEEALSMMSDISVMDGTLGKLALAAIKRSTETKESWLIMLVGAGGGGLAEVPLMMAAYVRGGLVRFGPISKNATLADIGPTLQNWYGLISEGDAHRVRGMCSTGILVSNCENTTNWP
ncbi:uncharacterized protein TM35_000014460 [Trypanosoma theileri]|uniref:Uncharacterized protein n=1 Tax=Trypanosoma theileri TaxID=67003 RepID=A0A1X0PAG1_9TRYP|nr:uncharacterized protein TM35_000014460 [Trypanosoma theileri]ORC93569.1 hypothetical protein TM35_000014460 [Trypanosoma theileri]